MQPDRYNEQDISQQIMSSANEIALAVGAFSSELLSSGEPMPVYIRPAKITYGQHHPSFRKHHPDLRSHGIPNIAMAYFFHEIIRASELLAEENGIEITEKDSEVNYRYLGHIIKLAKYSFPSDRKEMEDIAQGADTLAKYTPKVDELTGRLFILNVVDGHNLTLPTIGNFLRPNSREVFRQIAQEYDFQQYVKG